MGYTWQARAKERRPRREPLFVALGATALMLGGVLAGATEPFARLGGQLAGPIVSAYERLTFVVPVPRASPRAVAPDDAVSEAAVAERAPVPSPTISMPPPTPAAVFAPTRAVDAPTTDVRLLPKPSSLVRSELLPRGRSVTSVFTARQHDSVGAALAKSAPLAPRVKLSQEQRDETAREMARRFADAKEQHRPVAVPLGSMGGISIGTGWLSSGPSPERRRGDSIVHADNLRRLQRLGERVRWKQDSARRADSIAAARTQPGDSTDEF